MSISLIMYLFQIINTFVNILLNISWEAVYIHVCITIVTQLVLFVCLFVLGDFVLLENLSIILRRTCRIVPLRNFFVDRPESSSATHSKNCIFVVQKKIRTVWTYFLHNFTLSGDNSDEKKTCLSFWEKYFKNPLVHIY